MPRPSMLDAVLAALQRRFGPAAARWGAAVDAPLVRAIPTGFAPLDAALGGGIACSQATVLLGSPTAGTITVALCTLAAAQRAGAIVAYLDTSARFDPLYAADCGLDLDQLLLVRPHTSAETLEILEALVASNGLGALVLDAPPQLPPTPEGSALLQSALRRLPRLLAASPTALLLLHRLPTGPLPTTPLPSIGLAALAPLRLTFRRLRWIETGGAITGCVSRVTIGRRPFSDTQTAVDVSLAYGAAGDAEP